MGMPVETTPIGVDGAENADIQPAFTGGIQQIIDRQTAEIVKPQTEATVNREG